MTAERLDPQGEYPARLWYPYVGPRYLLGPPVGIPAPSVSPVSGDLRHSWACSQLQRGGVCDCGMAHWDRRISYERIAELLAEGWYEQDQQELST